MQIFISIVLSVLLLSFSPMVFAADFDTESDAFTACQAQPPSSNYGCDANYVTHRSGFDGYVALFLWGSASASGGNTVGGYMWFRTKTQECATPNYIDIVSGECVPPKETCFTDLDTGDPDCVFIGDDQGDGYGCVTYQGKTICIESDGDPNCYNVDGKDVCLDRPESQVCGVKNDSFQCLSAETNNNCGYFNGELVCLDKIGKPISSDSPDHPKNGGNADGDDTNDPTDPRSPGDGGDENNQPGKPASDFEGFASEKTLRGIKDALDGVASTLKDGLGGGGSGSSSGEAPGEDPNEEPQEPLAFTGEGISFEIDDGLERLSQVKSEYETVITNIRAEISTAFGSFTGGGSLQDNTVELFGYSFNAGLSKFAQYLQYLGSILLFAAAFISLGIIMGARD